MYVIKYKYFGEPFEIQCESYEEMMEININLFNCSAEPIGVYLDNKEVLNSVDIYRQIKKVYY